ncbi:hypothetical protein N7448_005972 [Penicillium atrosanguineum]|uniref:Stress response protein rds1p n=1 Tax=Penicillium atrosanguineum TaxID=1132637 RepID=A0A9W9GYW0_9EURO|nr:uncharacterized protein N7443_009735 [Penicillium atrosanguineum]KAJ5131814.1 hypothetical protein N7448_005972 [Penicillium atrosanguineum]KAJ5289482.1 hypothetical protein N7443_009735 [Penicillium atrosanguineum]KAJ5307297.1 hypothetical protein N7476_007953 [Penicillium atrosanguineum]
MHFSRGLIASMAVILPTLALPTSSTQSKFQPAADAVPGESSLFVNYAGKKPPIASKWMKAIPATGSGPAGPDDLLFQNLLSAEWIIYSLYQQAVDTFSPSDFTKLGLPNNTYQRIAEIRDNEAGHLRIFQDQISTGSIKPGPCKYDFGLNNSASAFLALQVYIEVSSMAFLTGLSLQAEANISKSALMAIGQVETRHNVWALLDVYNTDPFSGPSDTIYPYANQILDTTNAFIVPGSCPAENPMYPAPRQGLPLINIIGNSTTAQPGSDIKFVFESSDNQPKFENGKDYYAVFYHGLNTVSVSYNPKKNSVKIPKQFDSEVGIIMVSIADEVDAPTEGSVIAGPLIILEQPGMLTLKEPYVY